MGGCEEWYLPDEQPTLSESWTCGMYLTHMPTLCLSHPFICTGVAHSGVLQSKIILFVSCLSLQGTYTHTISVKLERLSSTFYSTNLIGWRFVNEVWGGKDLGSAIFIPPFYWRWCRTFSSMADRNYICRFVLLNLMFFLPYRVQIPIGTISVKVGIIICNLFSTNLIELLFWLGV
jgi:hypothetical protein